MNYAFLSASIPYGNRTYPRAKEHRDSSRPQRIRDVVLAVSREALRAGFGLVFGAHPSISPMVLTVAREFPSPEPRVFVFQSRAFAADYPAETLELADGVLGVLIEVDAVRDSQGVEDKDASLFAMRQQMLESPGLILSIFVGGMKGVLDEARMFHERFGGVIPAYAFGSAGAAARDLVEGYERWCAPTDFTGGSLAPLALDLLLEPVAGYTRIARRIFQAATRLPATSIRPPRPPDEP